MTTHEHLLIIDFGSQVTQLIARRVRESGVYCEIHPFNKVDKAFLESYAPKAIILSGGPSSVYWEDAPLPDAPGLCRWAYRFWGSVMASKP